VQRWRAAVACDRKQLLAARAAVERRGTLGEGQQEGVEAVGELGGDTWRPGEVGGGLGQRGTVASGGAAARQRGRRGRRRGGGAGAEL
jgi:hypothetical protein